jgi:F-type H+-transporting ATPase subunit alpha
VEIRPDEISGLIKAQIKRYEHKIDSNDVGSIVSVGDGIATVYGLDKAMYGELLEFPNDVFGMVLGLEEEHVSVVLMGNDSSLKEGDQVRRTNRVVEVPVGDGMLGRVVNALGQPIDGLGEIKAEAYMPIEKIAPGVMTRQSVSVPLQTGITAIDSMIPIGRGQRELIIGDRQTGKTTIAIDTIINQKGQNVNCIYVAIGQKNSTVAQMVEKLRKNGAMEYTTIVSATASEMAPLQYIAPYAGCTIAEHWMAQGKDVLIVYDDLSKHAVAYRALSLLIRRPPGREAYPGDVFYLHSRLLERAARVNKDNGGGSITALPIVETQAGDISAYIPTNVISITDGQIFLDTELFNAGQRPAIDSGLSVSRVGSAAQIKAMKQVSGSLKTELANYKELESFSQFGSDLDADTKAVLDHGAKVMEVLRQNQGVTYKVEEEVIVLYTVRHKLIDKIPLDRVDEFRQNLLALFNSGENKKLKEKIAKEKVLSDEINGQLNEIITKFIDKFLSKGR